jgi:anhydro-N-acetylmuramic acid kinase
LRRLAEIAAKKKRLIIGLMSGTSADGVDAALVEIEGSADESVVELLAWQTSSYPPEVQSEVLGLSSGAACSPARLSKLNFHLGHLFADAALDLCRTVNVEISSVDLIGSHGQTVFHQGPGEEPGGMPSTMQLGEPCVIAERTGVAVVADFRPRDIAAGGQGAPLVPLADYILFSSPRKSRCLLNLGGIANVTFVPLGCKLDASGIADRPLLNELLTHPFFELSPPKSTGRGTFGESFAKVVIERGRVQGLKDADIMMTAVSLTVRGVVDACRKYYPQGFSIDEVIVSGGGVYNEALMSTLRKGLSPAQVVSSTDLGLHADAKEAVAFAVLANETICGHPGNVPSATGADRAVPLGKIVP